MNPRWLQAFAIAMVVIGIVGIALGAVVPGIVMIAAAAIWLMRNRRARR